MLKSVPVVLVAVIALIVSTSARAGDDPLRFSITPYLWLPSVDTQLSIRNEPVEVGTDTNSFDILSKLDFVMLAAGEVRKGKVGVFYDVQYIKLSDDGSIDTPRADFDYSLTIADATLGLEYRAIDEQKFTLDVLGGARAIYAKTSIGLDIASGASRDNDQSKVWVDPIVGAKARYELNDRWALNGYADIGGFGVSSELTYQVLGTVSYSFNQTVSLQFGYRVFADRYENGDFKLDARLYGPVAGITFNF